MLVNMLQLIFYFSSFLISFVLNSLASETHKGLKRVTLMFALSDARDYSFSKVPYLEREEEITDQSNFVNNVT